MTDPLKNKNRYAIIDGAPAPWRAPRRLNLTLSTPHFLGVVASAAQRVLLFGSARGLTNIKEGTDQLYDALVALADGTDHEGGVQPPDSELGTVSVGATSLVDVGMWLNSVLITLPAFQAWDALMCAAVREKIGGVLDEEGYLGLVSAFAADAIWDAAILRLRSEASDVVEGGTGDVMTAAADVYMYDFARSAGRLGTEAEIGLRYRAIHVSADRAELEAIQRSAEARRQAEEGTCDTPGCLCSTPPEERN